MKISEDNFIVVGLVVISAFSGYITGVNHTKHLERKSYEEKLRQDFNNNYNFLQVEKKKVIAHYDGQLEKLNNTLRLCEVIMRDSAKEANKKLLKNRDLP